MRPALVNPIDTPREHPYLFCTQRQKVKGDKIMELITWEPFGRLNKIHSRLNDLFEDNFNQSWLGANGPWAPAMDILESHEAYIIRAELPGMKKEDITVELKDGTLTLSGERKSEKLAEGVEYRSVERVNGEFVRSVMLPKTVNREAIRASYQDGILEIHVPKADEAKPRQITVH
jgi:HSP20 family protein